jgi:hypothetical protein
LISPEEPRVSTGYQLCDGLRREPSFGSDGGSRSCFLTPGMFERFLENLGLGLRCLLADSACHERPDWVEPLGISLWFPLRDQPGKRQFLLR